MNSEANFLIQTAAETGSFEPRTYVAKSLGEFSVIALLCVSIVAPGFIPGANWPTIRVEMALLPLVVACYIWLLLIRKTRPIGLNAMFLIGALFSFSVTVSLIYGSTVLNHQVVYRDYFEILKAWLPVVFFTAAYEAELSEAGIRRLLQVFSLAILLVCLLGWAQYLNLSIAARLQPYYGDSAHNDIALVVYKRIYSTMTNPNVLGQLLSWTIVIYAMAFLFGVGSKLRNLGVLLISMLTLVLTGSRYGLIASAFGFILVMILALSARRRGANLLGLLVLAGALGWVFVAAQHGSYFAAARFQELRNPLQVVSLRGRLDILWLDAAQFILSSPWVGHGPAKLVFDQVFTDSEYLDILKFYGVIGLLWYLAYYLWPLMTLLRALKTSRWLSTDSERHLNGNLFAMRVGLVLLPVALLMNIGEFTYYNWALTGFLWMWVGITVRAARVIRTAAAMEVAPQFAFEPQFSLRNSPAQLAVE